MTTNRQRAAKWLQVVVIAATLGSLFGVLGADAQERRFSDLIVAPRVVHGPVVAAVAWTHDMKEMSILTEGAGWKVGVNCLNGKDWPVLSLEFPFIVGADSEFDEFAVKAGAGIGLFGNVMIGATYDLLATREGDDSGIFTGNNTKDNVTILFGLTAAWGNPNGAFFTIGR